MPSTPLLKGLRGLLGEIPLESIQKKPDASTVPEDLTTLSSYNLLPKHKRTIVVPGFPSVWAPATEPKKIKQDAGSFVMDPNHIDLVTDRRNLRLLLAFFGGSKSALRIDVEVVRSIVLFSCWTPKGTRFVKEFAGYGHEFEKASTWKPHDVRESVMHNRVIRYVLGGVKIIVRFEVDACIGSQRDIPRTMTMSDKYHTPTSYTVLTGGYLVEPSRIVEIKTGPVGKKLETSKNVAQLWFSQTPMLCTGHYDRNGDFLEATERDLMREGKLAEWEKANRKKLRKLVRVIEMIAEMVRAAPPDKYALVLHRGESVLKIHKVTNQHDKGIPEDLLAMWKSEPAVT
ncbi:hypothetical protein AJ80_00890 [Polytolypa hystricis UAMH7299]|uniref:Decapping nuclease n=1 Tax=Polytolypa hystricis (strain UAMH7299) TaxID=1447883 RepID=A0A2B7Z2X8_POLH7|nr:hypothetical protein AJ80_00890 [Polytolypa hystricis UAMH7299]